MAVGTPLQFPVRAERKPPGSALSIKRRAVFSVSKYLRDTRWYRDALRRALRCPRCSRIAGLRGRAAAFLSVGQSHEYPKCGCADDDDSGRSWWGHADLAGSLEEWVKDGSGQAYPLPCVDCAQQKNTQYRGVRGGNFFSHVRTLKTSHRDGVLPFARGHEHGARCARPVNR